MNAVARKREPQIAYQEIGSVIGGSGGHWTIDADAGEYQARRAVSCLVEPLAGDVVLVSVTPAGGCFVLAVLEREGRAVSLVSEGDLTVKVPGGRFVVAAEEAVDLVSRATTITSGEVRINARVGRLLIESLSLVGDAMHAQVEKAKLGATILDTVVDRVTQRAKRAYRFIEQFEQVRAERLDYAAKKNMSLHAENALVTAESLVKVDGAEIHLG